MDAEDPEERIADLERQLAAARAARQLGGGLTPEQVRDVAFSKPPVGKRGYHEGEVDAFLDRVEAALRDPTGRALSAEQVRGAAFSKPPLGRRGYNEAEVDAFLDRVGAALVRPGGSDAASVHTEDGPARTRQFVASSAFGRKFRITVTGDALTVDRRRGEIYSFADAQLGPWVAMGVALHLHCGRRLFSVGGSDRLVGPATRLDAPPVERVDASLAAWDFDELLRSAGGRWSGAAARGPAPGEAIRCLLFPNTDLMQKIGPFAVQKQQRLIRSLSQLELIIDVDDNGMRAIDPNSNAVNASASLSRVTAIPGIYRRKPGWSENFPNTYTAPTMAICLPGMQPLTIGCRDSRAKWRDTVPEHHDLAAYTVSAADWLTLVEKLGLAASLKYRQSAAGD